MATLEDFKTTTTPETPIDPPHSYKVTLTETKPNLVSYILLDPKTNATLKRWLGFGLNFKYYNYLREIDTGKSQVKEKLWLRALSWLQSVEEGLEEIGGHSTDYFKGDAETAVGKYLRKVKLEEDEENLEPYQVLGAIIFWWSRELVDFEHGMLDQRAKDAWRKEFKKWNNTQPVKLPTLSQTIDFEAKDIPLGFRENRPELPRENQLEVYNRLFCQYWYFKRSICPQSKWTTFWSKLPKDNEDIQKVPALPWKGKPKASEEHTGDPAEPSTTWQEDIRAGLPELSEKVEDYVDCPCKLCFVVNGDDEEKQLQGQWKEAKARGISIPRIRLNNFAPCKHPGAFPDLGRWRQTIRNQAKLSEVYFDMETILMEWYTGPSGSDVEPADERMILENGKPMSYSDVLAALSLDKDIFEIRFKVTLTPVEAVANESFFLPSEEHRFFDYDENGDIIHEDDGGNAVVAKKLAAIDSSTGGMPDDYEESKGLDPTEQDEEGPQSEDEEGSPIITPVDLAPQPCNDPAPLAMLTQDSSPAFTGIDLRTAIARLNIGDHSASDPVVTEGFVSEAVTSDPPNPERIDFIAAENPRKKGKKSSADGVKQMKRALKDDKKDLPGLRAFARAAEIEKRTRSIETGLARRMLLMNSHEFQVPRYQSNLKSKNTADPSQQSGLSQFLTPKDVRALNDHFKELDDATFLKEEYDGYDVFKPDGLVKWIAHAIEKCIGTELRKPTNITPASTIGERQEENNRERLLATVADANEEGQDERQEESDDYDAKQKQELHRVLAGVKGLEGPQVDLCLKLMNMREQGQHRDHIMKYTSPLMPDVKVPLLASQVTGLVHMLLRTCGEFPLSPDQQKEDNYHEVARKLSESYPGPQTFGGIVEDAPGMGKTMMTLAFFDWWAKHAKHEKDGKPFHAPGLLLVPDGYVFNQWVDTVQSFFPGIQLVLVKGGKHLGKSIRDEGNRRWKQVSPQDFKKGNWSEGFEFLNDTTKAKNSSHLFICSYSTWRNNLIEKFPLTQDELDKGHPFDEDVCVHRDKKKRKNERVRYDVPHWKGRFAMSIFDEGHIVRNTDTQSHWLARRMESPINWFLTATPIVNDAKDKVGIGKVLWREAEKAFGRSAHSKEISSWLSEKGGSEAWEVWDSESLSQTPANDAARLIQMDPKIYDNLVKGKHLFVKANILPGYSGPGATKDGGLDLTAMMQSHETKTRHLEHADEVEKVAFLSWHRKASKLHAAICKEHAKKFHASKKKRGDKQKIPPPPVAPALRKMAFCTASVQLAKFAHIMEEQFGFCTKIDNVQWWRSRGVDAEVVLELLQLQSDADSKSGRLSRAERLQKLAWGSPKLREILREIRGHCLPSQSGERFRFKKLLITEEYPLIAWYWELVLNFLHIPTQVLHSGLADDERVWVVEQFREEPRSGDLTHLTACILTYTINASGVNLDKDCNKCMVSTAGTSAAVEIQATARIVRVSQLLKVEIIRLSLKNSHDQWREAMQANKAVSDAVTKVYGGDGAKVILGLLNHPNKGQREIREIQASRLGQEIILAFARNDRSTLITSEQGQSIIKLASQQGGIVTKDEDAEAEGGDGGGGGDEGDEGKDGPKVEDTVDSTSEAHATGPNLRQRQDKPSYTDMDAGEDNDLDEDYVDGSDDEDYEEDIENDGANSPGNGGPKSLKSKRPSILEQFIDEAMDKFNVTNMTGAWKSMWEKLPEKERTRFNQEIIYTLYICTLDDKAEVTQEDLDAKDKFDLERGLRLLNKERFGFSEVNLRITPYIDYSDLKEEKINKTVQDEISESKNREFAAAMGISVVKFRDHQISRKRQPRQKFKRGDFLKNQYGELGTPLVEIRQRLNQMFDKVFEPILDEVIEDSEDSESE
ncbi:hypothetical protein KC354_g6066 [Hortaea werneckii]|nr:hypothetical protein KC354_g6066 [Hortaea werneckii]